MKQILRFSLILLLTGGTLTQRSRGAVLMPVDVAAETADAQASKEDALYTKGTKAMDEQRWSDAVTAFDSVVAAKGKRVDAAMYWKAYNLNKLGRKEEAGAVCGALRGEHPASTWNKECRVLQFRTTFDGPQFAELARQQAEMGADLARQVQIQVSGMKGMEGMVWKNNHTTTDDDIKILALNSLMREDPAKALPLLRDIMRSEKASPEMRRQALFVLGHSKQPEAQNLLTEIATNKSDLKLQRDAVHTLAIHRGKDSGPALVTIYRDSSDGDVKRAAVSGLFINHDAPRLVDLARGEKDLSLKREIVSQLALMKDPAATDYMMELLK